MDLLANIKHLLLSNNLVVVPDWGAFVANRESATIDKENKLVSPPSKKIAFNSRLKVTDGLLSSHIAKQEGIGYQDAEWRIKSDVRKWEEQLNSAGKLELNELGTFTKNDGITVFVPAVKNNYLADSFGLPSLQISKEFEKTELKVASVNKKTAKPEPNSSVSWFNVAASLALILGLAALMYSDVYFDKLTLQNLNILSFIVPEQPYMAPGTIEQAPIPANDVIGDNKTEVSLTLPAQVSKSTLVLSDQNIDEGFYLVLGSFQNERNANKLISRHSKIPLQVVQADNGYHRVVLFATTKASTAEKSLEHYRASVQKNAWLFYNMH